MGLYITNFSIADKEVLYCTSLLDFSVDITDDSYDVTLSGTYITCNNNTVSYTTSAILDGYRLTYSTVPSGTLELKVFASNSNSEFIDTTYIMQYGYEVVWNKVVQWAPNKEVPVSVTANNAVFNPSTCYFSTFFTTAQYREHTLETFISVDGSGYGEVGAFISPQSKYFMYGKTYSISIAGVKDFTGNTMPVKTYSFTLEVKN